MNLKAVKVITSTKFQLSIIIFTAIYVAAVMYWQSGEFTAVEKHPTIHEVTPAMKNVATLVDMGLHITSFPKFNVNNNNFMINGIVWFMFPIGTEALNTIKNFSFQNGIKTQLSYTSKPTIKLIEDHVLICFHVEKEFKINLDYSLFPIGDHRFFFTINNSSVTPYEVIFNCPPEHFTVSKDLLVFDWSVYKTATKSGYIDAPLIKNNSKATISYPCVVFNIDFKNVGVGDLMSLYLPMFVLFFIILFSLTISILDITRLNLVAGSVPILVLFRLVITNNAPRVGYPTHVDYVYYLLVIVSLIILLFQTYITLSTRNIKNMYETMQEKIIKRLEFQNSLVIVASLTALIIPLTLSAFLLRVLCVCG